MKKIQLVNGERYSYRGQTFLSGEPCEVSDTDAEHLLRVSDPVTVSDGKNVRSVDRPKFEMCYVDTSEVSSTQKVSTKPEPENAGGDLTSGDMKSSGPTLASGQSLDEEELEDVLEEEALEDDA